MVIAVDHGARPQQRRHQALRTGRVYHIPLRQLVAGNAAAQRAAPEHVEGLHPPADAQDRAARLPEGAEQERLLRRQRAVDVSAAGQQQAAAAQRRHQAAARHRTQAHGLQRRPVVGVVLRAAPEEHGIRRFSHG